MKITEERFNYLMFENDDINDALEYIGGIVNAIMDGEEPQNFEFTPETADIESTKLDARQKEIAKELGVKIEALYEVLSSVTTNRWQVYTSIKGGN